MPRNKPRLQLALYARPKHPGTYHYAIFLAPKQGEQGPTTKHHVKNTLMNVEVKLSQPWRYERAEIPDVTLEQRLLVRVIIGKVATSREDIERFLKCLPVYQVDDPDRAKAKGFSCVTWVRDALGELKKQGTVTRLGEWEEVQRRALEYVDKKREQGRWSQSWESETGVPLFDLLEGRELVA